MVFTRSGAPGHSLPRKEAGPATLPDPSGTGHVLPGSTGLQGSWGYGAVISPEVIAPGETDVGFQRHTHDSLEGGRVHRQCEGFERLTCETGSELEIHSQIHPSLLERTL